MEFGYYPGCALHGSSNEYEASLRACMNTLNVELCELDDWICCGATAAHALNHMLSIALPARNLAIAERDGLNEVFAPCPLCSMELHKARKSLADDQALQGQVSEIVESPVTGQTDVLNLIQVFQRIGTERLAARVKRPLSHIRAACYYGCLLTRPPKIVQFDNCEHPTSMQDILKSLGAEVVEWGSATECCGAGLTLASEDVVLELSHRILTDAAASGANCIVTACPMCHVNLDMKQADVERRWNAHHDMMVYYLSDLVGLALGLDEQELGIARHFVVTDPAERDASHAANFSTSTTEEQNSCLE